MPLNHQQQMSLAWLKELMAEKMPFEALLNEVVTHLRDSYPNYDWVGIYMLEGDKLHLKAWDGPQATEHTVIPLDAGLCGLAATTGDTINVPDVKGDDRYLQCFASTRSELVAPVQHEGKVYGEIDIDSDSKGAFDEGDERFANELCNLLGYRAAAEGRNYHEPQAPV